MYTRKLTRLALLISLIYFTPNYIIAEEPEIVDLSGNNLAWGRTYFFDAPRYKDNNVKELLDEAIVKKLKTFGILIENGNLESEYLFNYTILLGEEVGKSGFEEGKILFSIRNRKTNSPIWRSEIKGLAELESNENRKQRVNTYLDEAFKSFPQEYRYIQ